MILAGIFDLWSSSWPAGMTMLTLGFCFALALLIASEKLRVEVDPKVEHVYMVLPHIDCGACGFAGCAKYAEAVSKNAELIGKCAPGGSSTAEKIAQVLNLQISSSGPKQRPVVHCRAHSSDKTFFAEYAGLPSCTSANALPNAQACKYGCLGFGDCTDVCKFDALHMIDGLAVVDYLKCTGCGACTKTCPRNLIEMVPFTCENMMAAACRSRESGKSTRAMCKVGCIGCGLCVKQSDIFSVRDNLAYVDYARYELNAKTEAAMNKCPTGVIVYRGPSAPEPRKAANKVAAASA